MCEMAFGQGTFGERRLLIVGFAERMGMLSGSLRWVLARLMLESVEAKINRHLVNAGLS